MLFLRLPLVWGKRCKGNIRSSQLLCSNYFFKLVQKAFAPEYYGDGPVYLRTKNSYWTQIVVSYTILSSHLVKMSVLYFKNSHKIKVKFVERNRTRPSLFYREQRSYQYTTKDTKWRIGSSFFNHLYLRGDSFQRRRVVAGRRGAHFLPSFVELVLDFFLQFSIFANFQM